jgi:hypothetical protein
VFILDFAISLVFGSLYGGLVLGIALLAAVPDGVWQGMRWLWARRPGAPPLET